MAADVNFRQELFGKQVLLRCAGLFQARFDVFDGVTKSEWLQGAAQQNALLQLAEVRSVQLAIQFRLSYDVMAFFNTVASPKPIDFNYGAIAPAWEEGTFRLLHGISIGMAVVF